MCYEYVQFLNQKILEYLPPNRVKVGDKINFRCPICGDSRKSSTKKRGWVYLRDSSFYCFNCGTGLPGIKLLEILSGASYQDIKREYVKLFLKSGQDNSLSAAYEQPTDEPSIFQLHSIVKPEWKNPLSEKAREYLDKRLIIKAPFFKDALYSCYNKSKTEEYILIPWVLNGCEAYYQVNDFLKLHSLKYRFPKGMKKLIAGLDNVDVSWPYIICFEGYYDSVFVKNGVCLGTKAITDYQLKLINERFPKHQIVISFDNDASGIESMVNLLHKRNNFKYFKWFNPSTKQKDINDAVCASGNVNMFTDEKLLEYLILDKLMMKMHLIKTKQWKPHHEEVKESNAANGCPNPFWKKRQI